ncbi:MAG: tetratricopeptide repeat protein [Thermoanaerobaculum sp.]|nr:tetratricopeptide repeat protein [Thermoanaerobaculum sp.]MCX7894449.1 tetratricopeptide repeat protein [Thermoanaerobaculum sp.]MDW7967030.1 tetratricopeptide repeat protein [Thermoanaerobaculum sp.]
MIWRLLRLALALLPWIVLASCRTAPAPIFLSHEQWAQQLRQRGVDPTRIPNPLHVTEHMRQLAAEWAGPGDPPARLERLQRALFNTDQFPFTYYTRGTLTAAEAFFRREGNCLSFTNLFVALGRSLGIPVTTALVQRIVGSEREGDLIVVNTHVVAVLDYGGGFYTYDFDRTRRVQPVRVKPLDDLWITALYLNNRGADELRAAHPDIALEYFQDAVALAPEFAPAWANLGVAHRRLGNTSQALAAYRKALELDPTNPTVLANLAALFRSLGREEEAQQALRAANLARASPHQLLVRGDVELAAGRIAEAKKFYRSALRADPGLVEAYLALARAELAEGHRHRARKWIAKAAKLDPANFRVQALASELALRP